MPRDGREYIPRSVRVLKIFRVHDPARLVFGQDKFHSRRARMVPVEAREYQSANVALRKIMTKAFLDLLRCDVVTLGHVRVNDHSFVSGPHCGESSLPDIKRENIHKDSFSNRKIDATYFS